MLEIMAVINGENSSYSKIGFKSELLFGFSNATNHNGERKEFHSFWHINMLMVYIRSRKNI